MGSETTTIHRSPFRAVQAKREAPVAPKSVSDRVCAGLAGLLVSGRPAAEALAAIA